MDSQLAFTVGVITLGAKIAKADGVVTDDEVNALFHIAKADGVLHPREVEFLRQVAKRFRITETEFSYIKARHVMVTKHNPYDVLGVNGSIGSDELKRHYRRLVVENHPDKLIARGVPKEFVAIATEKLAAINEAYAQIANDQVSLAEQFHAAWQRHTGAD